jgi:2,3-bisphosphoglycerate-dependent phosphoglycerate mutase
LYKIVLLRHGESKWNKENRFTGWHDVSLTNQGIKEAKFAGKLLKNDDFKFDLAFTSLLKRARSTLEICLKEMETSIIPIKYSWRLNERHYGALQSLNKTETAIKFGDKQVLKWRRSYDIPPPSLKKNDPRHPRFDKKYSHLNKDNLPDCESLKDTEIRFMPFWNKKIKPQILLNKKILIVAHGNSLRALVKNLDNISNKKIIKLNIPTGVPLIYELDKNLNSIKNYYLGDIEEVNKKN